MAAAKTKPTAVRYRVRKVPTRIPVRSYSREFRPHGEGKEYKLDRIPAGFWRQVQIKAKREGVSLRGLILTYLRAWLIGSAPT